jgi:hypothetical protein
MKICLSLTLLLVVCVSGACRRHEQRYELKGKVVMVEKEKHLVTIAHEDVKGLMPTSSPPKINSPQHSSSTARSHGSKTSSSSEPPARHPPR